MLLRHRRWLWLDRDGDYTRCGRCDFNGALAGKVCLLPAAKPLLRPALLPCLLLLLRLLFFA